MTHAVGYSRGRLGIEAPLVVIEAHVSSGLPRFSLVGLPEAAVRESRDRVRSALLQNGFVFPPRRITVNLAPAELPKDGSRYDLAIALCILAATGQLPLEPLLQYEILGELALDGQLRPVRGVLPAALSADRDGRQLVLPARNAIELSSIDRVAPLMATHLTEVCAHLNGTARLPAAVPVPPPPVAGSRDLAEVQGQARARRALEIAAAGGHHLLLVGPPGTGKTLLAERLTGILPPMSQAEARESAVVAAVAHTGFNPVHWALRPFRAPHHSATRAALIGGGLNPRPGEVSLAHNGVLFLDELPEFTRATLEVLREPLESGRITISRAMRQLEFPARCQLVAAMNPCPCGYLGDPERDCNCTAAQVQRYRHRISGPLLDRIDLHVLLPRPPAALLAGSAPTPESSATVRARVSAAVARQQQRTHVLNARLGDAALRRDCPLDPASVRMLVAAARRMALSGRVLQHLRLVARTIADLEGATHIQSTHLAEAISYRPIT